MPDAYVTAHHLRDLLNEAPLEQLLAWSREPGLLPRVPAGPDRGKSWNTISVESLRGWSVVRDVDVRFTAETELARRGKSQPSLAAELAQRSLL